MPVVLEDDNYDFNFQASREPKNETWILPGDELLLECDYQTTTRKEPTFGGTCQFWAMNVSDARDAAYQEP